MVAVAKVRINSEKEEKTKKKLRKTNKILKKKLKGTHFSAIFRNFAAMNKATRDYIHSHTDNDVRQLALRGTKDSEVDLSFALEQIAGRQKAKSKIPSWASIEGIIYPPHLSMEQCSSEATARYKASLIKVVTGTGSLGSAPGACPRDCLVDLTGGFGIDFAFMAPLFGQAVYVERQPQLCDIAKENFRLLNIQADVVCTDGADYLHTLDRASLIFIDPARRDEHGGRTYGIADCTPNILELKEELITKADCILLKLSPMLDWRKAVADIGCVSEVHIVSVDNECKELLILVRSALPLRLSKNSEKNIASQRFTAEGEVNSEAEPIKVVCVNLLSEGTAQHFSFMSPSSPYPHHSSLFTCHYSLFTLHFLYEPNASIMKAGCFDLLEERFGVCQLDKNSHLFVSETAVEDFPGRQFIIDKVTSMNKRELKEALQGIGRANIAVRNFPLSAADLRKRLKLQDGGDIFIFATTVAESGHQLFICRKAG